jgi:hypothetical protein
MKAIWKYFIDVNIYNVIFSLIIAAYAGVFWFFLTFASFGTIVGVLSFTYFKKQEYYFYYNLGYTRRRLIFQSWLINVSIAFAGIAVYLIVVNLIGWY